MSIQYRIQNKIAKFLNLRNSELGAYINHFRLRNSNKHQKVVIFSQTRSGSTLLENLLGSTGYFVPHGELLNKKKKEIKYPYFYISGLAKYSKNFIFHVKLWHLCDFRKKPINAKKFIERLYKNGWTVIYIDRFNKLEQALSFEIAEQRRVWHITEKENTPSRIAIDCNHFMQQVQKRIFEKKKEKEILSNIRYFQVNYEEDLEDTRNHQNTVNKILKFMELAPKPSYSKYKKINRFSLEDLIINYREFNDVAKRFPQFIKKNKILKK